ncbi:aminotransferase class V-fold PLP-dependent enzyme [Paenibacillus sp.]|uniref:aminotransferase class V-fold PLP-dependent enzyme n=1 Tax=Paenibacillus sp. TaxID=58172 RepID=UPI0028115FA6|nr:aminotransferase class V-fold PLP-dependent enzyme [Paenibacillus sp.]
MKALIDKKNFVGLEQCAWFFSGAETPTHRGVLGAVIEYMISRSLGPEGRERNARTEQRCKANLARLLNGEPEQIAIMSSASEVISMLARAVELQPGDNVVIHNLEFPSGVLPWLALRKEGVEVRVVEHRDWVIDESDILQRMDERTRLVLTSHVSYLTGVRFDYRTLYDRIRKTKAALVLDATQSLGVVPVDLKLADVVVCSSYKWLLGVHGGGVLAVNPERGFDYRPPYVGWRSVADRPAGKKFESFDFQPDARRFELGYPSYPTVYALEHSTRLLLDVGVDRIERHVLALGEQVMRLLQSLDLAVTTPDDPVRRAGNISFLYEEAEKLADRLARKCIYVMGSEGRVRISVHAFNDTADIERLAAALPACIGGEGQ